MRGGQQMGYARAINLYKVDQFDENGKCDGYFLFKDPQEAQNNISENDVQGIRVIRGLEAMEQLVNLLGWKPDPIQIPDLILPLYAEERGLDGVCWNDQYDPIAYSAPRCVISNRSLAHWSISPA